MLGWTTWRYTVLWLVLLSLGWYNIPGIQKTMRENRFCLNESCGFLCSQPTMTFFSFFLIKCASFLMFGHNYYNPATPFLLSIEENRHNLLSIFLGIGSYNLNPVLCSHTSNSSNAWCGSLAKYRLKYSVLHWDLLSCTALLSPSICW